MWRILSPAKRITLIAAVGVTIVLFSILAKTASSPPMSLLYAGLDPRISGEVITALDRMAIPYDIRADAIYVPTAKRDSARMSLASEGLPNEGQAGYELLDKLNGFSTTSDMFDATYWRAKEGELARTILATHGVRAARVHIANPSNNPFARNTSQPTAVVTVTTGANRVDASQAEAIRYLVASAVSGLDSERVAVIDSERGVILSPGKPGETGADQREINDREQQMEHDILDLLEARVGAGNARVQVALDIETQRETYTERVINPDGRVISGKETTEVSENSSGSASNGSVSVSSNLPEGDAGPGGQTRSQRTETKETIKYDMSETRREVEKTPGAVKRVSIAVFVNQIAEQPAEGDPVLRSSEELDALKALVANAAGFNEARGDTLTIQALPFKPLSDDGTYVAANPVGKFMEQHLMTAIQILVLSVVTLILALFVVKPILMPKDLPAGAAPALAAAPGEPATLAAANPAAAIANGPAPDAIAVLKEVANARSEEAADLIKAWLETSEDAA
ncbi:MAG: flagellar basal-body MS-ring/collar protein FliF [Parvularculaceae bacterium]